MNIYDGGPGPRVDADALNAECEIAQAEDDARDAARVAAEREAAALADDWSDGL